MSDTPKGEWYCDERWIHEQSFPEGQWIRLARTDVEVLRFERAGIQWFRHRLISENRDD
jgi:hypothetical protein